ncbi:MAG TPA: RNA-binding cell elongation regulator Jag/EloR [Solirubrobacteraceae bacterium]|nr:RNA-binding cell elongation regulator Jag/EloR [Solirubrobacteraceae bacterium]
MSDNGEDYEELAPEEALRELLEEVLDALDLDGTIEIAASDGVLAARVEGEDLGLLIGRRGQTIDALQHLAQRIVYPDVAASMRVSIDANGYRERRAEDLREEADDAAEEAIETGRPVELEAMPAAERRVVHEHLRERSDVETHSEGEEPNRRLVISPARDVR